MIINTVQPVGATPTLNSPITQHPLQRDLILTSSSSFHRLKSSACTISYVRQTKTGSIPLVMIRKQSVLRNYAVHLHFLNHFIEPFVFLVNVDKVYFLGPTCHFSYGKRLYQVPNRLYRRLNRVNRDCSWITVSPIQNQRYL